MIPVLLIAVGVFGVCFLVDKFFSRVFRGNRLHKTGQTVRLNKRFATIGLLVAVFGVAAILAGIPENWLLSVGGAVLVLIGAGLVVYYLTFGVFYDADAFMLTTFGKKSKIYDYADIRAQQLFTSYGNIVIELYLTDGRTVQLQMGMEGVYPFLDTAFSGWLRRTGRSKDSCDFYDPDNSCWFPPLEG